MEAPKPAAMTTAPRPTPSYEPIIVRQTPQTVAQNARKARPAGTIQMNFDKATLRSVIDSVLGDALGIPYTVDERIDGTVSLYSPQPVGREEALDILDGLLRANGATLIKSDPVYKIVPMATARPMLGAPGATANTPGYAITVYVPRYTSAANLQKLIEPLYAVSGSMEADTQHNLLLIVGGPDERRTLLEAAQTFDQDWLANQSVGIFPLRNSRAKDVAAELKQLFASGTQEAVEPGAVKISEIERLNAVMVVAAHAAGIDKAQDWVSRLDRTGPGERVLHTYAVQFGKAQTIAQLLNRLFGSGGSANETGSSFLPSGTAGARLGTSSMSGGTTSSMSGGASTSMQGGVPGATMSSGSTTSGLGGGSSAFGGNGSSTGGTFGKSEEALPSDNGPDNGNGPRIVPDAATNSLLILANAAEFQTISEALSKIDVRSRQILIEATIVEVTLNKNLQYGVQYFLRGNPMLRNPDSSIGFSTNTVGGATVSASGSATTVPLVGQYPGFNAVLGTLSNPSVVLSALEAVTDVKVVSSPQVVVAESHEALLKVGTQVPLQTQTSQTTVVTGGPVISSIEYHDTGVILQVRPRANAGDLVTLDIAQEVSDVVPTTAGSLTPSIDERRIESTVSVQGGQTVMLGGLISENSSIGNTGLPGLATVPLLGGLFGQQSDTRGRTELIVFITPHVMHDDEDAHKLTTELLGRLKALRPESQ